jgi:hypothetical protein
LTVLAAAMLVAGCNQNRDTTDRPTQAGGPSQRSEYSSDSKTNKASEQLRSGWGEVPGRAAPPSSGANGSK